MDSGRDEVRFSCKTKGGCCRGQLRGITLAEAMALSDKMPLMVGFEMHRKKQLRKSLTPKALQSFEAISFDFDVSIAESCHVDPVDRSIPIEKLVGYGYFVNHIPPAWACPALSSGVCSIHDTALKPAVCRIAPLSPVGAEYEMGTSALTKSHRARCPECFCDGPILFANGRVMDEETAGRIGGWRRRIALDQEYFSPYLSVALQTSQGFNLDDFLAQPKEYLFSGAHFMAVLREKGVIDGDVFRVYLSNQERVFRVMAEQEGMPAEFSETYASMIIQIKTLERSVAA